jgi:hypothetical protein
MARLLFLFSRKRGFRGNVNHIVDFWMVSNKSNGESSKKCVHHGGWLLSQQKQ